MRQDLQPHRESSRPHWARRMETVLVRTGAQFFRRLGWQERIEPFVGYGAAPQTPTRAHVDSDRCVRVTPPISDDSPRGWVRVLARVMVSPKRRASILRTSALTHRPPHQRAVRGWRSFFTVQSPDSVVFITVGQDVFKVVADEGGYVDVVLPSSLGSGWHEVLVSLTLPGGDARDSAAAYSADPVSARVALEDAESLASGSDFGRGSAIVGARIIGPNERVGLVSDLDDTAIVTALPRPFLAAWNSFVLEEKARMPVPGMSELYRRLEATHGEFPVIYLSTGAWNVVPAMIRFLARYRFPLGPMLMTDWGPTNTGFFRSGRKHKERALARLAHDFPQMQWILCGDDGQHDPVIYQGFARRYPGLVRAIAIRRLSPSEAVLSHGTTGANPANRNAGGLALLRLPQLVVCEGEDGYALMDQLTAAGILNSDVG